MMKELILDKETEQRNIKKLEAMLNKKYPCRVNSGPKKKRGKGDRWHR